MKSDRIMMPEIMKIALKSISTSLLRLLCCTERNRHPRKSQNIDPDPAPRFAHYPPLLYMQMQQQKD